MPSPRIPGLYKTVVSSAPWESGHLGRLRAGSPHSYALSRNFFSQQGIFLHFPKKLLGTTDRGVWYGSPFDRRDRCANATRLEVNACVGSVAGLPE